MTPDRRRFLKAAAGTAAGAAIAWPAIKPLHRVSYLKPRSRVAVITATEYSTAIEPALMKGLSLFGLEMRGRSVLLKPNLVECVPNAPVNTHPLLVKVAATCFRRLGARKVIVGEGPGHERDTEKVLSETGFAGELRDCGVEFVDLNRDELVPLKLKATYSGLDRLWLPLTVLVADFIVSMPKVKTHHWAGVTLSMKNMFGIVPGMKYGWPKNPLHWHSIHESILDICATTPIHFVIADGILAMEGDGPLLGAERQLNRIVLSDDPVAADATCARLMGIAPERIHHLAQGARFLGNLAADRITMLAESIPVAIRPFSVMPRFHHLIQAIPSHNR